MNRPKRGRIAPVDMVLDSRVQRTLELPRVKKMAEEFDPAVLGVLVLSRRADGGLYIVDGQHRAEAARAAGKAHTAVEVSIHEGLTLAEEAHLFRLLNATKAPSAITRFRVRLVEGEEVATHIDKIIHPWGWKVSTPGTGSISAVGTLEMVNGFDPDADRGVLHQTIGTITGAWGLVAEGVASPVLGGIGVLMNRYAETVNVKELAKTITRKWSDPVSLGSQGKNWKVTRGGRLSYCVAEILHQEYNKKRSVTPLADWTLK